MFVLDTHVVSELRRARKSDPQVLVWAAATHVASTFLSAITIYPDSVGLTDHLAPPRKLYVLHHRITEIVPAIPSQS